MNRQQRKHMEKQLGLHKMKKKMTREQRFEAMRQNIEEGNQRQEEMKEVRRLQEEGRQEAIDSARISSIATDLMVNKGMSWVESQEKAKEVYKREVESADNTEK
jgi:hypothetical protein